MERPADADSANTERLLERVRGGDRHALSELLTGQRDALRRMVELRLDVGLRGRIDASDVVQEAQLEAARRIDEYLARRPMPFPAWLRQTAYENLLRLRRRHAAAECRSVRREIPLPDTSSDVAGRLMGRTASPSEHLLRREMAGRLWHALDKLPELDREILLMRNFEGLSNQEVSQLLSLEPGAASKRHGRAILRLKKLMAGATGSTP